MVGCSGTFDTILEIAKYKGLSIYNSFNKKHFESIFKELISKNREERLLIDGMIPLRVDLIVVSCSIIKFLFDKMDIDYCKVSKYSLKEGVVAEILKLENFTFSE